jgi:hypothetical protein
MQWESGRTGTIYYTPSEKAKQKDGPHQVLFRASCPRNILALTNLVLFSIARSNASIASRIPLCPQVGLEPTTPPVNRVALIWFNNYSLRVSPETRVVAPCFIFSEKLEPNKLPAFLEPISCRKGD